MKFDKLIRRLSVIEDAERTLSDVFITQFKYDPANAIKGMGSDIVKTALIALECRAVLNTIGSPNVPDDLKMDYMKTVDRIWNNRIHAIDASKEDKTFVVAVQQAEKAGLVWLVETFEEFISNSKES
jgi:hypothetical protein